MRKWLLLLEIMIRSAFPPFYSFSYIESVCKKKLSRRPNDTRVLMFLSNFYIWYEHYSDAQVQLEKLCNLGIDSKSVKLLLSNVYFNMAEYEKVVSILSGADVLKETDVENYYLGDSLIELGRFKDSIEYLSRYTKHHPKDYEVFVRLGYAYYTEKMYDLALEAYEEAKRLNPLSNEITESIKQCIKFRGQHT